MNANFTLNLIRYIYKETSISQKLKIEEELNSSYEKSCAYLNVKMGYDQLPKVVFTPSKNILNNILEYSQRKTVAA